MMKVKQLAKSVFKIQTASCLSLLTAAPTDLREIKYINYCSMRTLVYKDRDLLLATSLVRCEVCEATKV